MARARIRPTEAGPDGPPEAFLERLRRLEDALGVGLSARRAGANRTVLRVRGPLEAAREGLVARGISAETVPGLPAALSVSAAQREAVTHDPDLAGDGIRVQGASSQRAALALGVRPGESVLDLAAAPGGKTLILADALGGAGTLVAVEVVPARFHRLRDNLTRAGAGFVRCVLGDGRRVVGRYRRGFDRVLLDAPCSAEARFRDDDAATFATWSVPKVRDMARKQWGLLGAAIRALRPGAELIYATCSFAPEENEANVAAHLTGDGPAVELLELELGAGVTTVPGLCRWEKKRWPDELVRTRRIVPDELHEGFFVARLRRV